MRVGSRRHGRDERLLVRASRRLLVERTSIGKILDRAVERCYRSAPFTSDRQRVEFLFTLYETITAPLLPAEKKARRR